MSSSRQLSITMSIPRYVKRHPYALALFLIILCAVALRLLFSGLGWPATNSDEGTMGLMARHIAYNGEFPLLFYGQYYMGSLEAYLAALFFHLSGGSSVFALRLSVILLDALFLLSMYLLTSLLYSKKLALFVVALLCFGSRFIFFRNLYATGGSTQTLLFGSLAFVLATYLALSVHTKQAGDTYRRLAGYGAWGIVVGLALWSDMIVVPFLLFSVLLLMLFCGRDLLSWRVLCLVGGLVIGLVPLILYNLHAPASQNSLAVFTGLFQGGPNPAPHTLARYIQGITATVQITLPTATGDPFCPAPSLLYSIDVSPHSTPCLVAHTLWSVGYLVLWLLSALFTWRVLWQLRSHAFKLKLTNPEKYQAVTLYSARLFLLLAGGIALFGYAISSAPLSEPSSHARYLVGLLIVTPAILWPLWKGAMLQKEQLIQGGASAALTLSNEQIDDQGGASAAPTLIQETALADTKGGACSALFTSRIQQYICRGLLVLIFGLFVFGTYTVTQDIPPAQAFNSQQDHLVHDLIQVGATHIYTDYWSCDRLAFVSQEKVICGVVDGNLRPTHNRYAPYYAWVQADPHAAYVFDLSFYLTPTMARHVEALWQQRGQRFRRLTFDGYVVYQPV